MSCAGVTDRNFKEKFAFLMQSESALFPYYSLMEAMKIEEMGTCSAGSSDRAERVLARQNNGVR